MTLGGLYRTVIVDPRKQEVVVFRRYFWAFRRLRRIRFAAVEAITYGYKDLASSSFLTSPHDSSDLFSVGLRLHNGEEVHLFDFYGDGTFTSDGLLPGWLHGDECLFDWTGTQVRESRAYVELLCKMLAVTVVPPYR